MVEYTDIVGSFLNFVGERLKFEIQWMRDKGIYTEREH
jgi:hypothetical protein